MKRQNLLRHGLTAVVVVVAALGLSTTVASASVNNFTVTDFAADYTLTNADKQGEMDVTERITVKFPDNNHGIERAIPNSYKDQSLNLKVESVNSDSGAPAKYRTYQSNGNTVLRIGDPSQTVTGSQEYSIHYRLDNVISFYPNYDELYWDVNGDQWLQPFTHVSVTLHLPAGLSQNRNPICYAGAYGDSGQNCTINSSKATITAATTQPLQANQTLSLVAGFDPGYFTPPTWRDHVRQYIKPVIEAAILPIVVGGLAFGMWWRSGRDPKGRGTIIPEFDAPDNLSAIEVGTITDFSVDNRDITAMIIDLAIRKYIRIIETKTPHTLRNDSLSYRLELLQTDWGQAGEVENALLAGLFGMGAVQGAAIDLGAADSKLNVAAEMVRGLVTDKLQAAGYFRNNPLTVGGGLSLAAGIAFIAVWILGGVLGWPLMVGLLLAAGIAYGFSKIMPSRTAKGVAAKEHILGLKLYLETAEKDRIKMLQNPDARYAANYDAPEKTVELFEKLLPYAMVLGVEKEWAKQFEGLYATPPDWYAGSNLNAFSLGYLAGSLGSGMTSAVNTSFANPSASGGSGFGGGGFSGGGGGGGGGGGW